MKTTLHDLLASGQPVIADGAMGTTLFAMGLEPGQPPELWNVEHPERIRSIHRDYIQAGAQIILTNSFGGSRLRLAVHGISERAAELNRAAAQLARAEADAAPGPVAVAGDMGPTGGLLTPYGTLGAAEAADAYAEQAEALIAGGADLLWVETMSDLQEIRAALEGARRAGPDFPLVATMSFDKNTRTIFGVTPEQALEALSAYGVAALGANCGLGPAEVETAVERMRAAGAAVPLVAKANAGLPHLVDGTPAYDANPTVMAEYAVDVRGMGATIVGACCGSTPEHIRAMAQALGKA